MESVKIAIIGSGPTGLGAAYRLQQLGVTDFMMYEMRDYIGGLASSFQDDKGFWWDIGGHVQFSHYKYFDDLMDMLLPDGWLNHERVSEVWLADRWVPYPFQNNIHKLPYDMMWECLRGLIQSQTQQYVGPPKNFQEWILRSVGAGIAKYFMTPYNFKVWAHPTEMMNAVWVGERVAQPDLARIVKNILEKTDDVSWGPNNTFRFPKLGGTGAIWRALGAAINPDNVALNHEVTAIDTTKHILTFSDGAQVKYEFLISTMPLDIFIQKSDLVGDFGDVTRKLLHSSTYIIGIGLEGKPNPELANMCWMYFPEDNCPFYRVTLFSKYSPNNVPDPKTQFSLMTEVSKSAHKPVNDTTIMEEVIQGLYNTKLITKKDKIVSRWMHTESYGYPTPSVERDAALAAIQPALMKRGVLSRGRFGMWKYEVSNQDHSLMQGVEAANFLVHEIPEQTAWYPNVVNGPRPY